MRKKRPRAILVDVIHPQTDDVVAKRRLIELESLVKTYGGIIVVKIIQKKAVPDYKTYLGKGKLDEILELAENENVDLIVINNHLKPQQLFTIERRIELKGMRVWDRVDLILSIFEQHASTVEAKLQIRLAGIRHLGPRIFHMGFELSRQGGGTGTRGIGETNTERMKRHLANEEKKIKRELEKCRNTRRLHRVNRRRKGYKTISIVGYTNAGKSSLLNVLTNKGAYVANELFATLDTRIAKLWLADIKQEVLLSDTIGFIQDLPPNLIQAFLSTLEETIYADILLEVIDVSDFFMNEKINEVESILKELNVENVPKIYVFNKVDLVKNLNEKEILKKYHEFSPVFISTKNGLGLNDLKRKISEKILEIK